MKTQITGRCEEWLQGFAAALACVDRTFDRPTMVKSVMEGYGVSVKMLRDAGVERYDLAVIREACK